MKVKVQNLTKKFMSKTAVNNISFNIKKMRLWDCLVLMGVEKQHL